tara:strand:+ start:8551 stop:8766 length:216 start_codon:yes stop_codon:yes gene_type:complete
MNFITNDIGLAAYLLMKSIPVVRVKNGRPFEFEFENKDNICNKLSIEFLNSESSRFDDSIKKIKLILKNSN